MKTQLINPVQHVEHFNALLVATVSTIRLIHENYPFQDYA